MTHPSEELLIEFALDDAGEGRRAEIAAHVEACDTCRAELKELRKVLRATADDPVPPRGLTYGADVWTRLEPLLPAPAEQVRGRRTFAAFRVPVGRAGSRRNANAGSSGVTANEVRRYVRTAGPWLAAAAAVLIVVSAFMAGRWSRTTMTTANPVNATRPEAADANAIRERVVLAALSDHVERAERGLLELSNAAGNSTTVDISAEQAWARDLLDANRLYRQSVHAGGSPMLSELLDDIEPILIDIIHSPSRLSREELRAMQTRIDASALVFKLRVSGAGMRARQMRRIHSGDPTS